MTTQTADSHAFALAGTFTANATGVLNAIAAGRAAPNSGKMRETYEIVGRTYMGFIRRRFKSASGWDGTWPPLSPAYMIHRLKVLETGGATMSSAYRSSELKIKRDPLGKVMGGAGVPAFMPMMILSGRLWQSLSEGGADHVDQILPDGIRKGTTVFYSKYHQEGRGVPVRRILVPPGGETNEAIKHEFRRGFINCIASVGGGTMLFKS